MLNRILLIGDARRAEFAWPISWLGQRALLTCVESPGSAMKSHISLAPEVVLFVQSWPGQWHDDDVRVVHERWPLARLMALVGDWCASEGRTGRICQGVWRVNWCDVARRWGSSPDGWWNLPRLATGLELLEWRLRETTWSPVAQCRSPVARFPGIGNRRGGGDASNCGMGRGWIVIAARSWQAFDALADACALAGYPSAWQRPGEPMSFSETAAGIWDAHDGRNESWSGLEQFVRHCRPARVIALMGFPRGDDWQRVDHLGATLLAKPFELPDLWHELQGAAQGRSLGLPGKPGWPQASTSLPSAELGGPQGRQISRPRDAHPVTITDGHAGIGLTSGQAGSIVS
jgi:hypothetical protein